VVLKNIEFQIQWRAEESKSGKEWKLQCFVAAEVQEVQIMESRIFKTAEI
jgi:hypothetical protein